MRLATVLHEGVDRVGVVVGEDSPVVHLFDAGTTTLDLVRGGLPAALEAGASVVAGSPAIPLDSVRLLAPIQPPTIRDFVAFEEHVEGMRARVGGPPAEEWYQAPTFYFTNPYAVIATGDDMPLPQESEQLDYELEVAMIVGEAGHDLSPEAAHDAIFGYTIMNDWSARDLQRREMAVNLGPAKGKDFATTLGPWIVTADELEDHHDEDGFLRLRLRVSVNGVETGRDLLSNSGWPLSHLIAYASIATWVRPGDVLGSGTCGNGGCLAELWGRRGERTPPPLQPGDVVEMTVEGIGTIRNRVVEGLPRPVITPARPRPRDRD